MRRLLIAAVLAPMLAVSASVQAAEAVPADPVPTDVPLERLAMIATGVVLGALVVHAAGPGDVGAIAGGLVGGVAADWWYHNGGEARVRALLRTQATTAAAPPLLRIVASKR